jgi:hypothetical protein
MRSPYCMCVRKFILSLLGNDTVNTFPQQRTHTQGQKDCWTWCYLSNTQYVVKSLVAAAPAPLVE